MVKFERYFLFCALVLCAGLITACKGNSDSIAHIWTNQSEFASYVELFNTSQTKYHIIVEYKENPAEELISTKNNLPDIVIGPWLKGEKARSKLTSVDYLFNELKINSQFFYGSLLNLGNIQNRQYLLPVSFNMPTLIFSMDNQILIPENFTLSLDQIQKLGRDYNIPQKNAYTQMGFSPRWNTDFLYLVLQLFDADFEENTSLFGWKQQSLDNAVAYLRNWTNSCNTSARAEDEFEFKYLYDPPYKQVVEGRVLFSFMSSDELFILPQDKIQNIDFRWISRNSMTAINDDIIYMGICKKAPHIETAEAFMIWFFNEKTQKALLDRNKVMGMMDKSFGISGGFSALRPVNEKIFPLFYPSILGHLPPADTMTIPHILPNNWEILKKEIVIPWLTDTTSVSEEDLTSVDSLNVRITKWIKTH